MILRTDGISKLQEYAENGIFSPESYNAFVFLPNNPEVCGFIKKTLISCIEEVIKILDGDLDEKKINDVLKNGLKQFNRKAYDTEDREFICHCFNKISSLVGINFSGSLNEWLYGKVLGSLINLRKKSV